MKNIVDLLRSKKPERSFDFKLSDMVGKVEYVFADENIEVKKGDVHYIKIKPFTIPPEWLAVPCSYIQNPLGKVVGVGEKFAKPVALKRHATDAIFTAFADGKIQIGEIVGAVVMLYTHIES
ncbi:MAG: DUF22 domain-containing protein [Methanocellales archaeon]|nr:DUF22 domain-containing protein [Methanocellales archaeon]MDD3292218.1 DUF22 domain-containing protein [Methanocellales archaeon]MDD5234796.1 DUF22 domain-containing protein [Methanocellales archaeon]MDD5484834.1 DUF22 domain-containing protein [Methanocellales archaeon]